MAGRILNRRELCKQSDQVEQAEAGATDTAATVALPEEAGKRVTAAAKMRQLGVTRREMRSYYPTRKSAPTNGVF